MTRINRKIVMIGVAAGFVAGAGAAAQYVVGGDVEDSLRAMAEETAQSRFVERWEVTSYERGYGSSKAVSVVALAHPGMDEAVEVTIDHAITHGPFATGGPIAEVESTADVTGGPLEVMFERMYRNGPPLTVDTTFGFGGGATIDFHSPLTDLAWRFAGGKIKWIGETNGHVEIADGGDAIDYTIDPGGVGVTPANSLRTLRVEGLSIEGEQARSQPTGLWEGESSASIERIELKHPEQLKSVALMNITSESSTTVEDEQLGFDMSLGIEHLNIPDYSVSDLRFAFSGERIPASFVQGLQQIGASAEQVDSVEDKNRIAMQAMQAADWSGFAQSEPRLSVDTIEVSTVSGKAAVSASAEIAGVDESAEINHPRQLAPHVVAEANVEAPRDFVASAMADSMQAAGASDFQAKRAAYRRLEALSKQGFIESRGSRLTASASFREGAAQVNGESLFGASR